MLVLIVPAYFVVGLVQSWSTWSLGRKLKELSPSDWARLGSLDSSVFRLRRGPRYEIGQSLARLRVCRWAFTSAPRQLDDREVNVLVWVVRISTIVTYGAAPLVLWLFLH